MRSETHSSLGIIRARVVVTAARSIERYVTDATDRWASLRLLSGLDLAGAMHGRAADSARAVGMAACSLHNGVYSRKLLDGYARFYTLVGYRYASCL